MAKVHLLTTAPHGWDLHRLLEGAALDRLGMHQVCGRPEDADLILFTDPPRPDMRDIRAHPVYRKFAARCLVLANGDRVLPRVPGLFVCAERTMHPSKRSRTSAYLRTIFADGERPDCEAPQLLGKPEWLFSFVGRTETSPVRRAIAGLEHPRGKIVDASVPGSSLSQAEFQQVLQSSYFVLCPRGYGSSSFRLFETLKAGRVPVIVSDEWVPPVGPVWETFSVRVAEADISSIPSHLEAMLPKYDDMRAAVRMAWREWFAQDVIFHRCVEWGLQLLGTEHGPRCLGDFGYNLSRLSIPRLVWAQRGRAWQRRLKEMSS